MRVYDTLQAGRQAEASYRACESNRGESLAERETGEFAHERPELRSTRHQNRESERVVGDGNGVKEMAIVEEMVTQHLVLE